MGGTGGPDGVKTSQHDKFWEFFHARCGEKHGRRLLPGQDDSK